MQRYLVQFVAVVLLVSQVVGAIWPGRVECVPVCDLVCTVEVHAPHAAAEMGDDACAHEHETWDLLVPSETACACHVHLPVIAAGVAGLTSTRTNAPTQAFGDAPAPAAEPLRVWLSLAPTPPWSRRESSGRPRLWCAVETTRLRL